MPPQNFDDFFKLTFLSLKLIGIDIFAQKVTTPVRAIKQTWWFYFMIIWLYQVISSEIYWLVEGIQLHKSFTELTFMAPCMVFGFVSTVKVASILRNRLTAQKVMVELKNLFPDEASIAAIDDPSKIKIIRDCKKNSNKIINLLFWPNLGNVLLFVFFPLCISLSGYLKKGQWINVLPFTMKYPFDPYNIRVWPWVYIHQFISCAAVATNMFSSDSLYCLCCIQIHTQFYLLKVDFEKLIDGHGTRKPSKQQLDKKLFMLLKRHQELINLVYQLEEMFSISNFYNYGCSSFLICLSGFNLTINNQLDVLVPFSLFLVSNLAQIFLLCYFGDMVMRSSTAVAIGVYSSNWHLAPLRIQRILLIVLKRSQKPCKITAARYVPIDLKTFTKIISTAWSYFALLRTIYSN